jgi:predicted permease
VDIATSLYRRLLQLFPPDFRGEAGPELLALFRDGWLDARASGASAILRFLSLVLFDLFRALPSEWYRHLVQPSIPPNSLLPAPEATMLDTLRQDIGYAWRTLRATPVMLLVPACTIALGVGATTTMFSIANALLLRPPVGVYQADRLLTVHSMNQEGSSFHAFSYPDYQDLAAASTRVAVLSAWTMLPASVRTGDEPKLEAGMLVSANYFTTLGTRPALGRFFTPEEDRIGGPPVAVISHGMWQRRFGGDPNIIGRPITVNGHALTVVGVTEAGFHGHLAAIDFSVWTPVTLMPLMRTGDALTRNSSSLEIVGRLEPGVQRGQAATALKAISIRLARASGLDWARTVDVRRYLPVPAQMALAAGGFLALLVTLGGLVLLIAGANVANMLLARAAGRQREVGIRLALGASRGRLVRQLVTESLLLFLAGGTLGTGLAYFAVNGLSRFQAPVPVPVALDFHLDQWVLLFSLAVTLVAGLVFGLAPALQATRSDLTTIMRNTSGSARAGRWRLRGSLVSAQVAGTAFLLVIAGLFIRALGQAGDIDVGFNPDGVYVMGMELRTTGYEGEKLVTFADQATREVAAVPGVISVAQSDFLPLSMSNQQTIVRLEGAPAERGRGMVQTDFSSVSPNYFQTLQLPVAKGRDFTAADREGAPLVAIINETLAQQLWPGEAPLGKRFHFGGDDGPLTEVIGVTANASIRSLGEDPVPMTYVPIAQVGARNLTLLVRVAPGLASPGRALRDALHRVDPELPLAQEGSYNSIIAVALLPNRIAMLLATLFGAIGVTLAAVGLYGLLTYRVQCRRKEIGIRMALGAGNGEIRRLVIHEAMWVTGAGLLVGVLLAGGATQVLRSMLFGVSALDPVTYGTIGLLLLVVCWAAAAGPLRRALRTSPMEVLRNE